MTSIWGKGGVSFWWGYRFQGLEGLKISIGPAKFLGRGEYDQECSPYPEVMGMEEGRDPE